MLDFSFSMSTTILFGNIDKQQLPNKIKRFGRNVLVVTYSQGFLDQIKITSFLASLKEADISISYFFGVQPNPTVEHVSEGIEFARSKGIDFILAIGGGSAMDCAKGIAIGVHSSIDVWEYTQGARIENIVIPLGVIVTIPASGSEVSSGAILNNQELGLKRGIGHEDLLPKFAVLDPSFTLKLPMYQTCCGIVDMLSHAMERYFTSSEEVDLIDRMAEGLMKSIVYNAKRIVINPSDIHARSQIMLAGSLAHNGLLGVGRTRDWSSHYIEHEISALYPVAHGAGLAILTPAWMEYVYKYDIERFAMFARNVFEVEVGEDEQAAIQGIEEIRKFYNLLKMPTKLRDVGVERESFERIAKQTLISRPGVGSILKMNEEHIINILNLCF